MLENGLAVLHDEHGKPAAIFGIVGGARAISGLNVGEGRYRSCDRRQDRPRDKARRHSGAGVGVAVVAPLSSVAAAIGRGLIGRWRVRNSSTFGSSSRLRRPK